MGYCIEMFESTMAIDKKGLETIRRRFILLDQHNGIKNGGAFNQTKQEDNRKWFSWMSEWNSKTSSVKETLEEMRLKVEETDTHLKIVGFTGHKIGQEKLFFYLMKEFMTGYIVWEGEDGSMWKDSVDTLDESAFYKSEYIAFQAIKFIEEELKKEYYVDVVDNEEEKVIKAYTIKAYGEQDAIDGIPNRKEYEEKGYIFKVELKEEE